MVLIEYKDVFLLFIIVYDEMNVYCCYFDYISRRNMLGFFF